MIFYFVAQVDNLHSLPVLPCNLPGLIPSPVPNCLQGSVSTLWGLSGTCLQTQLSPFLWTSSVAPSPAGILSFVCTANTEKHSLPGNPACSPAWAADRPSPLSFLSSVTPLVPIRPGAGCLEDPVLSLSSFPWVLNQA